MERNTVKKLKKAVIGIFAFSLCLSTSLQPMTLGAEENSNINVSVNGSNVSVNVNGDSDTGHVIINGQEVTTENTKQVTEVTTEDTITDTTLGESEIWEDESQTQEFYELNTRAVMIGGTDKYSPSTIGVNCTYRVGDCNSDGKIDSLDLRVLSSYLRAPIQKIYKPAMDINKDGVIDSIDTELLKNRIFNGESVSSIKICLDAGHYSNTHNASTVPGYTTKYYESAMTWKLHKYLAEELQSYGFQVFVTRKTQDDKDLINRGKSAQGCDLFISLHSNAIANDYKTSYDQYNNSIAICNYYAAGNTNKKVMCDVSNNVGKVLVKASSDAIGLHGKIDSACAKLSTGSQTDGYVMHRKGSYDSACGNAEYYAVLRGARSVNVPGILLENSYHTSKTGTDWLCNDSNLRKLAKAEAKAIAEYYSWYE